MKLPYGKFEIGTEKKYNKQSLEEARKAIFATILFTETYKKEMESAEAVKILCQCNGNFMPV